MKQSQVLDILKMGQNVFLTGRAGSGKTFVLNEYIKYLKKNNIPVAITASTGIAATHLNGITIHSWSGIGIKDMLSELDIKNLLGKTYLKHHYLNTAVLIIDEVSMLHAHQLDLVNQLCQIFRQDLRPFGGLQIVLTGDFFQLPPISKNGQPAKFITESVIWQEMSLRICYLTEQFRQADVNFLKILNEIRTGQVSLSSHQLLTEKINQDFKFSLEPTKLYTHNVDVDAINLVELEKINSEAKQYAMTHRGRKNIVEILKKSCLAPEELILKIGAKVMFIKNNFETGVVNGTLGKVVGFDEFNEYPQVKIITGKIILVKPANWLINEGEKTLAEVRQFPLRLAWAITVHKSQGMSLDLAEIDLSKAFTHGMGYVALSRVRSLSGLKLKGYNQMALQVNPAILSFDKNLQIRSVNNLKLLNKLSIQAIQQRHHDFVKNNTATVTYKKQKKVNRFKTLELIQQKLSLANIVETEGFKLNTIISHLEKLIEGHHSIDINYLMPKQQAYQEISKAFVKCGFEKLKPVYDYLAEKYSYDDLKLVRLNLTNNK